MTFLLAYLGQVEEEWEIEDGWISWWTRLNNTETEGDTWGIPRWRILFQGRISLSFC